MRGGAPVAEAGSRGILDRFVQTRFGGWAATKAGAARDATTGTAKAAWNATSRFFRGSSPTTLGVTNVVNEAVEKASRVTGKELERYSMNKALTGVTDPIMERALQISGKRATAEAVEAVATRTASRAVATGAVEAVAKQGVRATAGAIVRGAASPVSALFGAYDYYQRRQQGQNRFQAAAGSIAGALGGAAGGILGSGVGPLGTIAGGAAGYYGASSLVDWMTGANTQQITTQLNSRTTFSQLNKEQQDAVLAAQAKFEHGGAVKIGRAHV